MTEQTDDLVLPHLLQTAASLLRAAEPLPPVTVCITLPEGVVQIDAQASVSMTDRMAMVDKMAELLTDATTRLDLLSGSGRDYGHHAKGTVGGVPVLITAVTGLWDQPSTSAKRTTAADVALALEAIAPWAAGLDAARVGDLSVIAAAGGPLVQLIMLADSDDDRRAAVASAVRDLPSDTTHQGRRAQALLPTGHRLKVLTHI